MSMTYLGRLGDRYTDLATQTLALKKHFEFFFSFVFQQKIG